MTVKELIIYLKQFPEDFEVTYLCPDGFEDSVEEAVMIRYKDKDYLQFLSYIHRTIYENPRTGQ